MKTLFLALVFIHGSIHLLGFVKAFGWKDVKELTISISKPMGVLWLAGMLLFFVFAWLHSTKATYAWVFGIAAVLVSQLLVFMHWQDARFGTFPNAVILLVSIVLAGSYYFQASLSAEIAQLTHRAHRPEPRILTEADIGGLPDPVRRWLSTSGAVGKPFVRVGRVEQHAAMKMQQDQSSWYDARAVQYSTFDPPGFVWSVDLKLNPMLGFVGRDRYMDGKGEMLIKLNALLPVVNERGEKIDEGTLQRYLGEVVWYPSMALSPYITWEPLDENSAKATMNYAGTQGSGVFHFSPSGDFIRFTAWRYRGNEIDASRSEWVLSVDANTEFGGVRVPSEMTATWRLPDGDWTWLKLALTDLRVNGEALK
ncbi:hypothetical protein ADIS_1958 [Lunatimonas lonarensis]|uniref:Uncharacterized protein n=1 Tax=Lunatimonas lonarensis TaxID=1232681 RepID=R7ZTV4_9BACT|nr:DUF6544 family protein [Lunatimonas lonarensis]EON77555.1 hypothetical protein ADIS_1958 [Lunatimonas lonarensis]